MCVFNILWMTFILSHHTVFTLDSCSSNLKCQDCITDPSWCEWCPTNDFNGTRCRASNSTNEKWCPENVENPVDSKLPFRNHKFSYDSKNVVQIKPQAYKIRLRRGKTLDFPFSFQGAQDFPVDLYFLMDASKSMSKIKNSTAEQSEQIYMTMRNITKNVQLGFGSFVDKRAFPFTTTFNAEETYSFRHRLSLTSNFTEFKDIMNAVSLGTNRDIQEGGLDALAQVMVCTDLIGWRKESRKIIIFVTDGYYHAAGDGRLAGIFTPYDGKCYSQSGSYSKELEMDYPSVGMINKLAVERNMIVLFFVESKVEFVYNILSDVIIGSKVSTFTDSENKTGVSYTHESIAQILKDIYEKISSKVTLKKNIKPKHRKNLKISFKPECESDDSGPECDVEIGKEKQFNGTVKALEHDGYDKIDIDIAIVSIGEKLTLEIEIINDCSCTSSRMEANSTFCSGEKRVCGVCDCGDQRYGDRCICEKTGKEVFNDDNSTCIMKDSSEICSGHGLCECGECRCRSGYDGKFCQCDHLSCPLGDGKLCSGEEQGKCICGSCYCESNWEGDACDCSKFDCVVDGITCNGRGNCVCGACKCDPIPIWDKRTYVTNGNCSVTAGSSSHNLQCKYLEDCAKCKKRKNNDYCSSCENKIETLVVEALTDEYLNSSLWNACPDIKVDLGCYSKFVYRYNDKEHTIELVVERKENCAETHYIFGGIFLLVLVVIGVMTLVAWKLMTDARDRQEFKQFIKQTRHEGELTSNPLYQPAFTTFSNPEFRKRSYKL